ncbi:MAG: FtsH protease activity modulator HflK, partial [Desulfobulbaceae bacterium]|nr:FtsH protease activity modulator HflK [Desulfobulbaceae bacterium]
SSPEEFIAALLKKIKDNFAGGGGQGGGQGGDPASSGDKQPPNMLSSILRIGSIIAILFLLQILYSSFYTIEPGERGVITRFGKFVKLANPGLNFKIPVIDAAIKVDVEEVRKQEFGFRTRIPGRKSVYEKRGYDSESLMLTGDKNVINVEWIVQYKVQDPFNFVFRVRNVDQSVRDVSEMAVRRVVGNHNFDYVLSNREILEASAVKELQEVLNSYKSGVKIVTVKFQDVNPPDTVKPAFNEVNEADQDMKRLVNEAEEIYNNVIPRARGNAKKILEEAHGYAVERVNLAKGETNRFLAVLKEYRRAKDVTRKRMYLETMGQILPSVADIYVIDEKQRALLPFLDITGSKGSSVLKSRQAN